MTFDSLISILNNRGGFFSQFFFLMNHYIYCRINKINFVILSENWTYKSEKGWEDYFEPVTLSFSDIIHVREYTWHKLLSDYSIKEYEKYIPEFYNYNEITKLKIEENKKMFKLENYGFIYIRRGDKITTGEAKLINEEKYIELLLTKDPSCQVIFLQTDDYSCYIKMIDYINKNNLEITLYTNCDENYTGAIESDIHSLNSSEIYDHTINLLTSIDISRYSNTCIVDYDSNVSRFIKLFHSNPENVYDINNKGVNYDKKLCPSYAFDYV